MTVPLHKHYDVVIIGGGMVGLSLACALQKLLSGNTAGNIKKSSDKKTVKILLLESSAINSQKALQPGFDARSTVLSFGTVQYLEKIGLWSGIKAKAEAIHNIHVSDQNRFGSVQIRAEDAGVDALGFVVENQDLGQALNKALLIAEMVEVMSPVQVRHISHQADSALLECQSDEENFKVKASLVVLADGGRSGLSEQLGIHRIKQDYKQVAIIANVAFSDAHNKVAYERFTPQGPLALLPLTNFGQANRAALVWTQHAHEYKKVLDLSDEDFLKKLQDEFGHRLGTFTKVGERAAFPLSLQIAEEQIRHNLVLLGNVAHALHPVAGQGFNLAFRDTMRLAENISTTVLEAGNPGDFPRLQAYLHSTTLDQEKTIGFSHYLTQFFSNNQAAMVWLRKFGLLSIDHLPPLKQALSNQAMGVSDKLIKVT